MFKVGDKVKCLDDNYSDNELKKNEIYTVRHTSCGFISLKEASPGGWNTDRFEAVESSTKDKISKNQPISQSELAVYAPKNEQGTGVKHDQDKPEMALLSSIALLETAKVMTFGKLKYSANNWRGGFAWTRPLSAALRHIFAYLGGQDKDPETGISHLAHAICCLMFVLEFEVTHPELDDRYKGAVK